MACLDGWTFWVNKDPNFKGSVGLNRRYNRWQTDPVLDPNLPRLYHKVMAAPSEGRRLAYVFCQRRDKDLIF